MYVCICMYIYIHIYIYTNIHIYVYESLWSTDSPYFWVSANHF